MIDYLVRIQDDYGRRGLVVDKIDDIWQVLWFNALEIGPLDATLPVTIL
jgi:hypothetical protein